MFRRTRVEYRIIPRERHKLRLPEYQTNAALVSSASKILNSTEFSYMLDCVQNEHPGFWVLPQGATELDRVRAQCLSEGYTMALANLEALGKFVELKEMPEATFEQEEKPITK